MNKRKPRKEIEKFYCRKCMKYKAASNFYETGNKYLDANGLMSICRDCCHEVYEYHFSVYGDTARAIYETCRDLDIRFNNHALEQAQSHIQSLSSQGKKAKAVFGYYKSKISSTGAINEGIESFGFRDSDVFQFTQVKDKDDDGTEIIKIDPTVNDFELTPDILEFWGYISGYGKWHYKYLVDKYSEYTAAYECDTPVMEELFRQVAFESLEMLMKRQRGEDPSRHLKTIRDLLNDANIKPVQESGANATDQVTYGVLIKKWEDERPIPEPDPEWADVDGIKKLIRVYFLGHLCKILGIVNEYSKEYDEEMSKFRVDIPETDDPEEGDE